MVRWANTTVCRSPLLRSVVRALAGWLAAVEVVLMVLLALGGQRRSALRMLAAVGAVYLACDVLGALWPRPRPFERLAGVEPLVTHSAGRSFPSRHVASGLAMAAIGGEARPRLGRLMAAVAWLLGASRVAAGVHYPSDVAAGAALGRLTVWCLARCA